MNILPKLRLSRVILCVVAVAGVVQAQTPANAFFDDTQVQVINVTMAPADWAALQQNYLLDTYYHANMTWKGESIDLGIRSHGGSGSRSPIKPNLDFNFAHYTANQTFHGLPFVLLKANNEDSSNLHEWISMKLYRAMGLPAPREAPAQLFVNNQLLGFYYIVEHEDVNFLQRDFGESGGYLYEWEYGQEYEFGNLGPNPNSYAAFLELKTDQTSPDLQTFVNFIQAVNAPTSSESGYITGLSAYMNPKLFLTYCATENVLTDVDGVLDGVSGLNNFYLYQFQNSTLYQMIAWDKDRTFSDPNRSILDGVTTGTNINILAHTLYGFSDYKDVYLSELTRAATLMGGAGGWADSQVTREWSVISAAALNDPNKQCDYTGAGPVPCGTEDTEAGVEAMHTYFAQRSGIVLSSAASAGYQAISTNPQIQSVSLSPGYTPLQLSPGALAAAFGANLGPSAQPSSQPLPRIAGPTFVAVDGVRAPLVATGAGEIGFQIPEDQAPGVVANVVVSVGGAMSNSAAVDIWTTSPGILAVARANGSVAAAGNAPAAGEIVTIYVIGLGAVTPDVPIGGVPPANSVATTIITPQLTLGTAPMNVLFSGLAPGFVGLYQINAQMPATLPPGASAQLTLTGAGAAAVAQLALQ